MIDISKIQAVHNHRIFTPEEDRFGLWRTYVDDPSKARNRREITAKDEQKFYEKLADFYSLHTPTPTELPTLTTLYPEWIESKRADTTAESYIIRLSHDWKSHYQNQEIALLPIESITPEYLERWLHRLAKGADGKGIRKTAYYNITCIVRQMLQYAKKRGIIKHDPMLDVEINTTKLLQARRKRPDHEEVFTKEEVSKIQDWCVRELSSPDYHRRHLLAPAAVLFQLQSGVRVGELCALKFSDISGDYLHIQRMYRIETKEIVEHPKTPAGERDIYITPAAKEIIDKCRSMGAKEWLFSTTDDPLPSDAVQRLYRILWRDVIGGAKRGSHKARKTYISALVDARLNLSTVRQIAGHTSELTILQNYTFDRSLEREQEQKIERATEYND